jgi:hypothetical protein
MTSIVRTYKLNGITVNEIDSIEELSTEELKTFRMNICNSCDRKQNDGCLECSCLLVNRIAFTESFCPIGKW